MKKTTTFYTCRNPDCDNEFELSVEYSLPIPAQISGPPENCYPAEGGEFEIVGNDECPKCKTKVDQGQAADKLWDKLADDRYDDYDE